MRRTWLAAALIAFATSAGTTAASAQFYALPDEPMIVVQGPLTMDQARAIAFGSGIVVIDDLDFDNFRGRWEIEGRDRWGRDLEMDIDARTGQVVRFEAD